MFLDEVWSESETASQELGENLQDNVFTALRVLGRGFVESNEDLNIDPDDEEALDELKEQSLVFLYRLMFVLYAEARGLIHPEDQRAQDDYEENFSLDALRLEIHDEIGEVDEGFEDDFSTYSTGMWSRLEDLFRLIDQGEEDLGIPPYNGGLFDHEEHNFLTENEVSNRYLAEVIYRLSTTQNDEGRYVLADYADLDTRHLGSVYEGLLEHQFRIAPEQYAAVSEDGGQVWKPATEVSVADAVEAVPEGGLYVVNDEGERKATGAYYTPDYVVTYIVEETVGPLVEEIREDLIDQGFEPGTQEYIGPFFRRVTDLRILDPAMGSGHFLTKATGYLSEQVMAEVREAESEFGVAFDEQHIRREIAKECIYGVDLNGMAVELAKLSMWLETLSADRPLAFLDHHFKQGNSLVGSDIEAIEELESDANGDDDQYSLAEFGATREGTIERLMDIYSEFLTIENETVEDVREMKRKYAEIEHDELRRRLVAMANVHTAERFGLDVPGGAYERMSKALEDDEEWANVKGTDWFRSAQVTAGEQNFFHWKLAFPEVFYKEGGTAREDAGFDAVIGNPPYVKIQNLRQTAPEFADYATREFETSSGRFDIYALFVERGVSLTNDGRLSYILPNKFFESGAGQSLRNFLASNRLLRGIADFGRHQVFEGVTTYTCILTLAKGSQQFQYAEVEQVSQSGLRNAPRVVIEIDELNDKKWALTGPQERGVLNKLSESGRSIGKRAEYVSEGIVSGDNEVVFVDIVSKSDEIVTIECPADGNQYELESELVRPLLRGDYIERFGSTDSGEAVVYPYEIIAGKTKIIPEEKLRADFPRTYKYLSEFESRLRDRGSATMEYPSWYALWRPREKQLFEAQKIVIPDVCQRSEFTLDREGGTYFANSAYGVVPKQNHQRHHEYLLGVLNSTATWFYIYHTSTVLRGDFRRFMTSYLSTLPIPDASPDTERDNEPVFEEVAKSSDEKSGERLSDLAYIALRLRERRNNLNLELLDYINTHHDGIPLTKLGIYQPPEGVGDTILAATKEDYGNIRVGTVKCERKDENTVVIHAKARYKPDDEDAHETDQWGYTESAPMPAMRLTDLSETEADLVEHFVPVAVKEAGGFAGFRETATKTNSLVDRLEAITLPDPDDVADDLEWYRDAVERADELDKKIQRTDGLIDEIVYDLYGLTDEEIEIIEEAVVND
jgi:type I restriction-modification system DNA methylase subunit